MLVAVLVLVVVAGGVAATVRALAGQPAVTSANANHPGDVLLVPGYGGSTTALDQLASKITAVGGRAIVVKLAGDGTGDLQVQANVLNGYVNQALAAGSGPVTVIGYSAGGVVAWLWDVDYDGVAKARRIITLGSPLHGVSIEHGQLPTAPLVVGIVLRTLGNGALTPPHPSDCRSLTALGGSGS